MANNITLTGSIGRTPSLNFTGSQTPVWGFSLAYTPSRKTDNGWEDTGPTLWFDVAVWGDDATDLAERYSGIERGRATVTGRLSSRTWTNKEGVEVTQMTINADAVTIHAAKAQRHSAAQTGHHWAATEPANQWGAQQQPQGDPWGTPAGQHAENPPF